MKPFRLFLWVLVLLFIGAVAFSFTSIPPRMGGVMLVFSPLLMGGLLYINKISGWENDQSGND